METTAPRRRSPGMKLLFAVLVAAALAVPLMLVYALVWDRQDQSRTARQTITMGWGGAQVVTGPVLVIPYRQTVTETTVTDGRPIEKVRVVTRDLFLSPERQRVATRIDPQRKKKSIYETVLYSARLSGTARFTLPDDLARQGIDAEALLLERAELHFGVSDSRGLQSASRVQAGGSTVGTRPGEGLAATGGSGFYAFVDWDGLKPLAVEWSYALRGSESLSLVPRGGNTEWNVRSAWPHPSFSGSFLPTDPQISEEGFSASFGVPDLALGQGLVLLDDPGPPVIGSDPDYTAFDRGGSGTSMAATVGLVEPVDLYSRIDRSVKYGFLVIGFTFLTYLMFDIVTGARVAVPEYLLTGAGLVLFFVMLLAAAEVIGFTCAYIVASAAIIGLTTAYSAAVLKSWRRAQFLGAVLARLYTLLFVLLNLEAWSLMIGSVLLFAALAGVMYATRNIEWSEVGRSEAPST